MSNEAVSRQPKAAAKGNVKSNPSSRGPLAEPIPPAWRQAPFPEGKGKTGQGVGFAPSVNFTPGDRGYGGFFRADPYISGDREWLESSQAAHFTFVALR